MNLCFSDFSDLFVFFVFFEFLWISECSEFSDFYDIPSSSEVLNLFPIDLEKYDFLEFLRFYYFKNT